MQACEQCRQIGPGELLGNAKRKTPRLRCKARDRSFVSRDELARRTNERRAAGREANQSWCPFDQLYAEPVFEPFQLHADHRLRCLKCVGGAGEALQVGNKDKGLDRLDIEFEHDRDILVCYL